MLVNVAVPYRHEASAPRSRDMAFYAPSQPDFLFTLGAVEIICQPMLRAMSLEWTMSRNMVRKPLASGTSASLPDNSFQLALNMDGRAPGFYDLTVKVMYSNTLMHEAVATFGWRVMDAPLFDSRPADFDKFWENAIATLPDPAVGLNCVHQFNLAGEQIGEYNVASAALPECYDPDGIRFDEVEVYKVDFASADGVRVYGWYTKPLGHGPFPALLVMPGANNNARPAPVEHARHGYATLDVQVHGYPVDLPEYAPLPEFKYDSPHTYIHREVYLNALQGARAIRVLPGVDPERVAVTGGSQGGRLSIVVAALDHGMKASIPGIAHYAYRPWLQWTERCNAHDDAGASGFGADDVIEDERYKVERYFDSANFAPRVECPVLMNAGLIDGVSPATGVFAIYRRLNVPKEMISLPNIGHDWSPNFDRYAWRWLANVLGK